MAHTYFVTGGTGFIGRFLIDRLLALFAALTARGGHEVGRAPGGERA